MPDAAAVQPAPFAVRPAKPEDAAFILGTWLEHCFRESLWGRRVRAREYFAGHRPIIVAILSRAQALIACDPADPDTIFGYIVHEATTAGPVVHFCYVKKSLRRLGVGRALVAEACLPPDLSGVRITHATRTWFGTKEVPGLDARCPGAIHDPFAAWAAP